nr:thiamine pyrophosphate-binding protein [Eggerthella lenta]
MRADPTASALFLGAFFDELERWGVHDVVVSPGSRSTPLAMTAYELSRRFPDRLRLFVDVDERGAAFFALGLAKASGQPAAVICTSGTAVANYYPAVLEAESSRVPLIVLTGDRPARLQGLGAPQTCDQLNAYGSHVRAFRNMPEPAADAAAIAFARSLARDGRRGRAAHRRRVPGRARALQLPVRRTAQARPAGRRAVRNRPKRVECAVRSAPHPSVDLPRSDGFRSRARTAARSSGAGGGGRGVVRDDGRDGCAVGLGRVVRVPAAGRSAFGLAHRRRPAGHRPVRHRARRSSRCAGSRGGHPLRPLSGVEARHRVFGERGRDQHRGGSARDARFQLRHRRAPALYAARFLANDAGGKAEPRRRRCR